MKTFSFGDCIAREAAPLSRVVLVVCENGRAPEGAGPADGVTFVPLDAVGAELLEALSPDVVLSPLMTPSFDCIDLARILAAAGYRGLYRAYSPPLPAPDVILREMRVHCPEVHFDLVTYRPEDPSAPTA